MKVLDLVSITTATYNSEKTLSRTIESVLNQTYPRIEYIIVDGNSKDNTLEIAHSYEKKFEEKGYAYKIVSEPDRGMYDAINKGIRLATGTIVGNINSDDWYEIDAVEKVVKFFKKSACDFMYGNLRMHKPDGSTFVKTSKNGRIMTSRNWNHPTQFAKRKIYIKNPYKLESMHDDFDLLLRVKAKGVKIAILNEVLANFTMEGMSHEKNLVAAKKRVQARYKIYRNNGYSRIYMLECFIMELMKWVIN